MLSLQHEEYILTLNVVVPMEYSCAQHDARMHRENRDAVPNEVSKGGRAFSRTDCNEGDNCRADLASSSTVSYEKDTCIASNTLPLCQPKEILEC
ncbi:hypothetical protein FRX31_014794 [Thalictrum thalictroides]|uniref:Uncharacterized protein n=1 Tax=Thalictrum thalictroides TaxID=46969 RepID=A0A7J6WE10_THATH|nr:hypothetical protein FRX31_014794 [Thalictrum thalictroides]